MTDHSRATLLGSRVTGESTSRLEERLESSTVVITVDTHVPGAVAVARGLLGQLRRLPGHLALDPTDLDRPTVESLVEHARAIDADRPVAVRRPTDADIRAVLAPHAPVGILRAIPDAHGWRVGRRGPPLAQGRSPSGLGVMATAAAVAAEAFKVTSGVSGSRGRLLQRGSFCPVTLTTDPGRATELPSRWSLDAMLLGTGAIGSATALILSLMPVDGRLDLVDPERFEPENVGTYAIGDATAAIERPWKTALAAQTLARFTSTEWHVHAADLPELVDGGGLRWPGLVLSGLDSGDARRDAQHLWPDVFIDGATGDTMAGLHVVRGSGRPCLACFFPPKPGPVVPAASDLAALTTLPRGVLVHGEQLLTEEIVQLADEEHRARLREHIGRPVCGLSSAYGIMGDREDGYRPAVPFVAMAAAALVVGRLVAIETGREPRVNLVQYDVLVGPEHRTAQQRRGSDGCDCSSHREVFERVRSMRAARTASP